MKRYMTILLTLLLLLTVAACGDEVKSDEDSGAVQNAETLHEDGAGSISQAVFEMEADHMEEMGEDIEEMNQINIKIGESTLTAVLEDNESAKALKELLADGVLTIPASNYGGFEKVCSLGTELPRNDSQTTTRAGDICLYNGNQIVIFYGSNSWAYTRLGKILDADGSKLEKILSGGETQIMLSLEEFR